MDIIGTWNKCTTRLQSLMLEVSKVYPTLYTGPLTPPRGKSISFCLVGLAAHQSEEAALLTFWDLSNYKGICRQGTQSNPNS